METNKTLFQKLDLQTPLRIPLRMFYVMGLSIFDGRQHCCTTFEKVKRAKFCILNIFIIFFVIIAISIYNYDPPYGDNFGKFNDKLKLGVVIAAHLVILCESVIAGGYTNGFFQIYSKIHLKSSTDHHWKSEMKLYWKLFSYLGGSIAFILSVEITYLMQVLDKDDWLVYFTSYTPCVFICRCRLLQFILSLELIRVELEQLNRELLQSAKGTGKVQMKFYEKFICNVLPQWMKRYEDIFEMSHSLSKSMPISPLVVFIAAYIKILSDCYWAYWVNYAKFKINEIFECSLLLPSVLNILLVLVVSKNCMRTAKLIPQSLHSIRHSVGNLCLSRKIQHFSLQICHQQIIFKAFGCFTIDCYIASGVLLQPI
ncbi:gustatory receptor 8a-like isoform X3 [Musca domestica]|uniref:Gustatory receptor n=1 Tax=Musca domestica TaxID=7370 RepID=A0ABM3VE57_MUSDO|nr:gustatory receptor 8a-like isoform X3 [Musca domestica]